MDRLQLDKLAQTYIQAQDEGATSADHPSWWAIQKFYDLEAECAELCWDAILKVIELHPSDHVLGMLGAGPLEDLIDSHGADFIDRIEDEARKTPAFMKVLSHVWEGGSDEVWLRIDKLINASIEPEPKTKKGPE